MAWAFCFERLCRPVGWSESGGGGSFSRKCILELPKAGGLGAASGGPGGGPGGEALKFKSHLKHIAA